MRDRKGLYGKKVFLGVIIIVSAVGVSGSGLDYFVSLSDQVSVSQPDIEMGFGSDGGLMWQSSGDSVNLNNTNSFNYSFSDEKNWYDLNVTVDIQLESDKVENLTEFEFGAYNLDTNDYYSCSSTIDSQGSVQCDNALSMSGKVSGFNITFSKDSFSDPKLSTDSKIRLEAAD